MKIKDIMRVPVDPIDPLTTVAVAAQKMRDEDVGCLLVGRRDQLVGIITDGTSWCVGWPMGRTRIASWIGT